MSKTFCALPFRHLTVGYEGTARVCCVTNDLVTEHGAPMSLNVRTMDEIWNSAYMRNIRRGMLKGERVSTCEVCYRSEAASGHSYRTMVGSQPIQGKLTTLAEMYRYGAQAGFRVDEHPSFIKLEIGNLCNLKCRMCYGGNSSQIERDPVHGKWSGGVDPLHAVWRGEFARIGPEPRIGVQASGLYPHQMLDDVVRRWSDGHAIFNVPLQAGTRMASLEISFHPAGIRGQHFQVIINGQPTAKGVVQNANTKVSIDLQSFGDSPELTIELLSNRFVEIPGEPERGLPLSSLILRRKTTASGNNPLRPQIVSSRRPVEGPWYMDDHKLFDEVLKSPNALRRLYITGGEPLINDRVTEILDFLVDHDAAQHIHLQLATNCTHVDPQFIKRLKMFREVDLLLSLDGVGETFEYIRHPARWSVVDTNVRKLKNEYDMLCYVAPVVSVYNVLRLTDLYRYCDALGVEVIENILGEPARLAIQNLPPRIRKAAAAKIFEYHDADPNAANKPSRLSLARYLNELAQPADPAIIHELMVFTNDLDVTRGQSIRRTHPELVQLLAEDGFEWIDEVLYANGRNSNTPARERDYAWL